MKKIILLPGSEPLELAKYEAFCHAYINNGQNGAKAAITAGYAEKHASREAVRLKEKPEVANRLGFLSGMALRKHDLSVDDFVQTIQEHLRFDISMIVDKEGCLLSLNDLSPEVARCVVGVDVNWGRTSFDKTLCDCGRELKVSIETSIHKYRTEGKSKYLEQLGKYLQVLKDQVGLKTFNELQKRAADAGEELYLQSIERSKTGKPKYDHSEYIDTEAEA